MRESNGLDATSSEAASERPRTGRATLPSRAVRCGGCGRHGNGATQQSSGTSRPQAQRSATAHSSSLGDCCTLRHLSTVLAVAQEINNYVGTADLPEKTIGPTNYVVGNVRVQF